MFSIIAPKTCPAMRGAKLIGEFYFMKDSYSEYYKQIRTNAENNWPKWKKEAYNKDFATSKHARKFEISEAEVKKYDLGGLAKNDITFDNKDIEFWEGTYDDMIG